MVSRSTVTLSVALVVLLAGCSGVIGDDALVPGDGDDAAAIEYPAGYAESGVEDAELAAENHADRVLEADSFAVTYKYDVDLPEGWTTVDVDYRVALDAEESLQNAAVRSTQRNVSTVTYHDGEAQYQRSEFEGEPSDVAVSDDPFDPEALTAVEVVEPLLANASYDEASVGERNGETVVIYEATDADADGDFLGVDDPEAVTDFSATLMVDTDGLVVAAEFDFSYVGEDDEERFVTMSYELFDVGETSVDRPEWASE